MSNWFLHPAFLWLAPLVSLPIIIHLLNRLRYRRVRWAAIQFLLTTERRAVRRARLRQILLMLLRMALLAAALLALAQPIFRGGLAVLLGGSSQTAVVLDASASMSAAGSGGSAFERGKQLVAATLEGLPRSAPATGGVFSRRYDSPFRQPLQDREAVIAVVNDAPLTGGTSNVPRALRDAAESLGRGGGGGTIWLLTDLQASGWRADDPGEWEQVRDALKKADNPQLVITDLSPGVNKNLTISDIKLSPSVLIEGDEPKLTATVHFRGESGGAVANVGLFLDGRRIDSRAHQFAEPGKADVVFRLPALASGSHAGRLELSPDAMPGDDVYHFVLRTAAQIPVLAVDGAPSSIPFEGAADFVTLALQPPESRAGERSDYTVKEIAAQELPGANLSGFAAVVLADLPPQSDETTKALRDYAEAGGLLIVFPGKRTDVTAWNATKFPGIPIQAVVEPESGKRFKLGAVAQTSPIVASLPAEGLDQVLVQRLFRLDPTGLTAQVLIHTEGGEPFLVRLQVGKGRAYVFAVSAQADYSNLPFRPPFLLVLHRAIESHLVDAAAPLSLPVFAELRLSLPPAAHQMILPDGKAVPVMQSAEGDPLFDQTTLAGVYRLVAGDAPPADPTSAPPIAALNVPAAESELDRIEPAAIHTLLPGASISFLRGDGRAESFGERGAATTAASSFPLAVLAMVFLLGEVLLAWSMGRATVAGREQAMAAVAESPKAAA